MWWLQWTFWNYCCWSWRQIWWILFWWKDYCLWTWFRVCRESWTWCLYFLVQQEKSSDNIFIWLTEAVIPDVFYKKGVFKNFAKFIEKHRWQSLFFNKVAGNSCNFIKNETLAQVFSCKFCEISKNIFFTEHLRWLLLVKFILKLTIT